VAWHDMLLSVAGKLLMTKSGELAKREASDVLKRALDIRTMKLGKHQFSKEPAFLCVKQIFELFYLS